MRFRTAVAIVLALVQLAPAISAGLVEPPVIPTSPHAALAAYAAANAGSPIALANVVLARAALDATPDDAGLATLVRGYPRVAAMADAARGSGTGDERLLATMAAQPRPSPRGALPPLATFVSLDGALDAFFDAYEMPRDSMSASERALLRSLAPASQAAVAEIVAAHILQLEATRVALATQPIDLGLMLDARDAAARAVLAATPRLQPVPAPRERASHEDPAVAVCNFLAIDPYGEDNVYHYYCNLALVIEMGGTDLYLNNAAGAAGSTDMRPETCIPRPGPNPTPCPDVRVECLEYLNCPIVAALFVDVAGDDAWISDAPSAAKNGAAVGGSGMLFDLAGNDTYAPRPSHTPHVVCQACNGAARLGSGFLYDASGDDRYEVDVLNRTGALADGSGNGAAQLGGAGFLFDAAGDDEYSGSTEDGAMNGAGWDGLGVLVDLAGDDAYNATVVRGAANGAAQLGAGVLVDLGGNDAYNATILNGGAANGAAALGVGVLLDADGDNTFGARVPRGAGAANGAALGRGYVANERVSAASLVDVAEGILAQIINGQSLPIPDDDPTDGALNRSFNVTVHGTGGAGVLVAGPGNDTFTSNGTTQGAASDGSVGILLDLGGVNSFHALDDSFAQGAGRNDSLGVLRDGGYDSTYRLDAGSVGQGTGLGGVGVLYHDLRGGTLTPVLGATARFQKDPTALASAITGSGVGLNLDLGFTLESNGVVLDCDPVEQDVLYKDGFYYAPGFPEVEITICLPTGEDGQRIAIPFSDDTVDDAPKPRCSHLDAQGVPCTNVMSMPVFTDDQREWMEDDGVTSTLTGGLAYVMNRTEVKRGSFTLYTVAMYDRTCRFGCGAVPEL